MSGRHLKSFCSLILVSILFAVPYVNGQYADKDFVRYSVQDGLTDNGISSLIQDDMGYIWIGTDEGLNRFDGNSFHSYYQSESPLQLRSGSITRLKKFGFNQIGILTKGGFHLFNTDTYTVKDFVIPDSTALSTQLNALWDAVELPDQSFAITTAAGFYVFDHSGHLTLRHDAYTLSDIPQKRILYGRDILKLTDRSLLVYVNETGLAKYDHDKKIYRELTLEEDTLDIFSHPHLRQSNYWIVKQQLTDQEFIFIPGDRDEVILYNQVLNKKTVSPLPFWVSSVFSWETKVEKVNDSLLVFNDRTNGFYFFHLNPLTGQISGDGTKYLPDYKVISLLVDKDSRLWIGTTEGLFKQVLQPPFIKSYHYPPSKGEKYPGGFTCIYRYKDIIYASRFSNHNGLVLLDANDMHLIKEITFYEPGSVFNEIRSVEMYYPDTLWLGSNAGLLWYDTKSGSYGKLAEDRTYPWAVDFYAIMAPPREDGYAWMCSLLDGEVLRYHIPSRTFTLFTSQTHPALPFERVKSIAYDAYGDVWIGGHSLARWNNQKQDFDTLITVYGGSHPFNDNILTLTADDEGSLWLHNSYNGLLEYRIKEKRFVSYSMKDGLPSDLLQSLSSVTKNKLWAAGNNHVTLLDTREKKFTIYGLEDGLPEHRPTGRLIYFDESAGLFYLCNNEYIVTIPFTPEKIADYGSGLIVQEVTIDQNLTIYQPGQQLLLNYNENNLKISYTVIDYEKSNYQFAYRLNEAEDWNPMGNQRSFNLNNLPPGTYAIQVRASGKSGIEKMNTLFLEIRSPFWKTGWFIGFAVVILASAIYFIVRKRVSNIRQKANLDKLLSQTEMKALQAQMNPHFIFNSLNSIGEMILNQENQAASHYLSKFARLIRMTLDQSTQSLVSLRNTIDYLERYMEMENIRNHQFTHEVMVDEELDPDDTLVPPMLIQPFIENALWHGLPANRKAIHVAITFKKENENLVCIIEDNGIGIYQAQTNRIENHGRHQSMGIANIQNRISLMNEKYGLHGMVQITDKKDIAGTTSSGTLVSLKLPLETKES